MSYGQFLVLFLCAPLAIVGVLMRRKYSRRIIATLVGVSLIAIVYTGPWDDAIIINGVWSYGSHQVLGVVIGHVPLEEYVFYILQVALTGSVTLWFLSRKGHP